MAIFIRRCYFSEVINKPQLQIKYSLYFLVYCVRIDWSLFLTEKLKCFWETSLKVTTIIVANIKHAKLIAQVLPMTFYKHKTAAVFLLYYSNAFPCNKFDMRKEQPLWLVCFRASYLFSSVSKSFTCSSKLFILRFQTLKDQKISWNNKIARATSKSLFSLVKCITDVKNTMRQMLYNKEKVREKTAKRLIPEK